MDSKSKMLDLSPQVVVADVVESAEYYRDILGFKILNYFGTPPVYSMVERDGAQIHFGKTQTGKLQKSNVPMRNIGFDFYIWVTDIEALFKEYSSGEVQIVESLVDRIYGNREFAIQDCHGLKIVFGQSIP